MSLGAEMCFSPIFVEFQQIFAIVKDFPPLIRLYKCKTKCNAAPFISAPSRFEGRITMAAILIIDSDFTARARMAEALEAAGHHCTLTDSITEGLEIARHSTRLVTILNARLSWAESFSLLRLLEEKSWPLLFVTADASTVRHLRALYQGPRGVLLAPFDALQLRHSVAMLLAESNSQLSIGALRLDVERRQCTLDGDVLTLTAQEFSLLQALMESPDSPLTREELLRTAWGYQNAGETRTVDVHIQRLRRKLGTSCIETVYKLGYRLKMA